MKVSTVPKVAVSTYWSVPYCVFGRPRVRISTIRSAVLIKNFCGLRECLRPVFGIVGLLVL
jgi:hypothetical protein